MLRGFPNHWIIKNRADFSISFLKRLSRIKTLNLTMIVGVVSRSAVQTFFVLLDECFAVLKRRFSCLFIFYYFYWFLTASSNLCGPKSTEKVFGKFSNNENSFQNISTRGHHLNSSFQSCLCLPKAIIDWKGISVLFIFFPLPNSKELFSLA